MPHRATGSDIQSLDFAALRTLRLVYRLNSFSRAADELGVQQSTVSYTIDRLRKALGDPLFVRQGGGIAPTDRCRAAIDQVDRILTELDILANPGAFDPAKLDRAFVLSCNYYARMTFIGDVVRRAHREAPGLRFELLSGLSVIETLVEGPAELSISPVDFHANGVYRQTLLKDVAVNLMDPANPLAKAPPDMERLAQAEHIAIAFGPRYKSVLQRSMEARGLQPKIALTIPDPAELPNLIQGTNLIATLPSRFATLFQDRLAVVRAPFDEQVNVYMYWMASSDRAPLHIWLRGLITEAAAQLAAPPVV